MSSHRGIDRRALLTGSLGALAVAGLGSRAAPAEALDPPMTSKEDFVAWEVKTRGEQPKYVGERWDRFRVIVANKDAWNALDDATKKVVADCGDKAAADGLAKSKELTDGYLKTLAEHGMKVAPPSDELNKELEGFGQTMTEEWLKKAGPDGKEIIDAYKAM